ncbi:hypothetical protein SODG_004648 [Sodalis praecaptivus]|nr:hypothetical protein NVIRENTERO_02942 [Sodalis praecaptivus]
MKAIDAELEKEGLSPTEPGKGRNVWFCTGYTLVSDRTLAVALHDCDIVTYDRGMLARLLYPVVHPRFSYEFCKGFYARVANGKMNGRVVRLLIGPLLRSLENVYGQSEYLGYLNSFRYPLSGEFAMRARVMHDMKIPSDWGLEIGLLSEIYRNYSPNHICQVEIADNYDHKHQPLAEEDGSGGLKRMSNDIIQSLYRKLATMGVSLTSDSFRVLKATYYRNALDILDFYHHDAIMNGLSFDQHSEEALWNYLCSASSAPARRLSNGRTINLSSQAGAACSPPFQISCSVFMMRSRKTIKGMSNAQRRDAGRDPGRFC